MIYMIILGLISLLSLKVGIGSIRQLAGTGGPRVTSVFVAVTAFTVLSWNLALMYGLSSAQGLN